MINMIVKQNYNILHLIPGSGFIFFSMEEYEEYLNETTNIIYDQLYKTLVL